jgi:tRNA A37 methylthiotransferase MiaB
MDNQVTEEIKNERSLKLRKIASELRERFISLNTGKTLQAVAERINYIKNYASGMSENYIKVYFPSDKENEEIKIGRIVNVKTNLSYLDGLKGEVV